MDESRQWVEFGRWLAEQRDQRGLRRRDAARKAKVTEAQWRDLETGRKQAVGGIKLLPNPSSEVLERVASALEVPIEDVLARAGRGTKAQKQGTLAPPSRNGAEPTELAADVAGLAVKLEQLSGRDLALVGALVDTMLEHEAR